MVSTSTFPPQKKALNITNVILGLSYFLQHNHVTKPARETLSNFHLFYSSSQDRGGVSKLWSRSHIWPAPRVYLAPSNFFLFEHLLMFDIITHHHISSQCNPYLQWNRQIGTACTESSAKIRLLLHNHREQSHWVYSDLRDLWHPNWALGLHCQFTNGIVSLQLSHFSIVLNHTVSIKKNSSK